MQNGTYFFRTFPHLKTPKSHAPFLIQFVCKYMRTNSSICHAPKHAYNLHLFPAESWKSMCGNLHDAEPTWHLFDAVKSPHGLPRWGIIFGQQFSKIRGPILPKKNLAENFFLLYYFFAELQNFVLVITFDRKQFGGCRLKQSAANLPKNTF